MARHIMKKVIKSAAVVTIFDADKFTPKGARAVAAWLRRQSAFILKYHKK